MKKFWILLKANLSHDMNLINISTKKKNILSKYLLPTILIAYLMLVIGGCAYSLMMELEETHLEYVALTLFAFFISIMTLLEGIYKSSSILFNCQDDQLLLSLPINKKYVLIVRIIKLYLFEFLFNTVFFLPAIVAYAIKIPVSFDYYVTSFVALLLLPIVPIIASCLIGFIITSLSSKAKNKKIIQTILSALFILIAIFFMFKSDSIFDSVIKNADNINSSINKVYYPIYGYISLINHFNFLNLFSYIVVHILISVIVIIIMIKFYFKVNSNSKKVMAKHGSNNNYTIKTNSKLVSFIKKELNRFISTPVLVVNAGLGLVLFIIGCAYISIKFDSFATIINQNNLDISIEKIYKYIPILLFTSVTITSFLTSITSSMISLEGKSFNILKVLPIKPLRITLYKVFSALVIIVPCLLIGDFIIFIKFKFDIISIILIILASILMPFISSVIGILMNLKFPKMNANNDAEVVKQSASTMISVLIGFGYIPLYLVVLVIISLFIPNDKEIMLALLTIHGILAYVLYELLVDKSEKMFKDIVV